MADDDKGLLETVVEEGTENLDNASFDAAAEAATEFVSGVVTGDTDTLNSLDKDVQLGQALSYAGIKNHVETAAKLTEDQKKEMIGLSRKHKAIQNEILTFERLESFRLLKKLQKEYERLGFSRWKEEGDGKDQALRFRKFLKDNLEEKDFDSATNADGIFSSEFITSGNKSSVVGFFALTDSGAYQDDKSSENGWIAKEVTDSYNEFLSSAKELFESDQVTPELVGNKLYLKMLDKELISGDANGKSPLLNFIKWTEQQIQEREVIGDKIRKAGGIPPKQQDTTDFEEIAEVKSDEFLSDEVVERQRRIQDQCFLTNNFNKIMKESSIRAAPYKNFISVQGEPFIATNNLTFHKGQKSFINLTSTEMSMLLPRVQLSKVIYGSGGSSEQLASIPFIFGTHSDFKDPSMLTMSKRARGDDAGIESFTFAFEGQDYATADKILVCNATYFFKSMSDFIAEFSITKGQNTFDYSYADLAAYPAGRKPFTIKADVGWQTPPDLSSLVGSSRAKKLSQAAKNAKLTIFMNVVSFNYEVNEDGSLKVFVEYRGWINDVLSGLEFDIFVDAAVDQGNGYQAHKVKIAEYLVTLLRDEGNRGGYQMTHIGGMVDAGEDMGLETSLINNGRFFLQCLDTTFNDTPGANNPGIDVFSGLFGFSKNDFRHDPAEGSEDQFLAKIVRYNKNVKNPSDTSGDKEFRQSLIESARGVVQSVKQEGQLINHGGLLEEIFKEGLVYVAKIPEASMAHYQTPSINRNLSPSLSKKSKPGKSKGFSVDQVTPGNQRVIGDDLISATNKAFRGRAMKNKQDSSHFPEAGGANGRFKDGYSIYFVTFGTILNVVMDRVYKNKENSFIDRFKVLVGSASTDRGPFTASDISIADIPVSLDLFTYWYLTEVMERDQTTYGVATFIQNMLSKLILPSMGADCQENTRASDLYTIKGQIYNVTGKAKKTQGKPLITTPLKKGDRVESGELSIRGVSANSSLKNINSYYYIFMDAKTALRGTEKFELEKKEGNIITLGTGYNRGLTKSIKFKGNEIPYFQEAADALLKDKSGDSTIRRMLKFHDADLELFGNTIFYPGMVVYISPNFPGINIPFGNSKQSTVTSKKIASTLGIGGYYVITKVRSNIDSSGGFTTTIVANYEAGV